MYVTFVNIFIHIFWNYLFVQKLNWGLVGSAMATNFSFAVYYFGLTFFMSYEDSCNFIQQIKL